MKIAIIGGGTAGYIAAAQVTKKFPEFELYHIYDSNIPVIGVGEGTILGFPEWLSEITNLSYDELQKRCCLTRKFGACFENWGVEHKKFMHHFYPINEASAYHISADKLVELLKEYVQATRINKKVTNLESDGATANVCFEDNTNLKVDIAIDARGFPKTLDRDRIELSWIPTNAALIRQSSSLNQNISVELGEQVLEYKSATRTIARPHGWIFVIPLTNRTSYGYVYNSSINSVSEIETDFDEFMRLESINYFGSQRNLKFPNFTQRTFFDGAVFKLGNAASFLEPLEATAIACALQYIVTFSHWPLGNFSKQKKREKLDENDLIVFNRYLLNYVYKISLFVGWHYVMGSCFDTEFWRFAKSNFNREIKKIENKDLLYEFENNLQAGSKFIHPISNYIEFSKSLIERKNTAKKLWNFPQLRGAIPKNFAQWPQQSFAEMGYGIGYYS